LRLDGQAASKIKQFFLAKIALLTKNRKELTARQRELLPLQSCYEFVSTHIPDVGSEIRAAYVEALSTVWLIFCMRTWVSCIFVLCRF
jgi:hypothetical protein